jgi:hypothetical protein
MSSVALITASVGMEGVKDESSVIEGLDAIFTLRCVLDELNMGLEMFCVSGSRWRRWRRMTWTSSVLGFEDLVSQNINFDALCELCDSASGVTCHLLSSIRWNGTTDPELPRQEL